MVANSNPTGNPNSRNSAADMEVVLKTHAALLSIVDQLVSNVWDAVAAHATFDQFERSAREILRQTGERMLTLFVKSQGNGDLGDSVTTHDGETLHRSETPRDAVVHSTFGVHAFRQFAYSAGKNKAIELRPVSARLERSGMRWTLEGARQMLHLRAAFQSDYWRPFLDRRIAQETARIHRHRLLLNDYQPFTLGC